MDGGTVGFALAAGLVAAFSPCGFAMLPAYLTLVVLGDDRSRGTVTAVSRALGATAMMALGFLLVFGTFGLAVVPLASQAQRLLPFITVMIGAALLAAGAWLLSGRELALLIPKPHSGAPTARLGSMFGYGLAYALASLSCTIGPFLAYGGAWRWWSVYSPSPSPWRVLGCRPGRSGFCPTSIVWPVVCWWWPAHMSRTTESTSCASSTAPAPLPTRSSTPLPFNNGCQGRSTESALSR